jgi:hypothetical protein
MAGAGWRQFVAGEVLTAAQVQDYLQDQAVMDFASNAARTSALASPSQGMISYLTDSNSLWYYDGTAWTEIVTDPIALILALFAALGCAATCRLAAGAPRGTWRQHRRGRGRRGRQRAGRPRPRSQKASAITWASDSSVVW